MRDYHRCADSLNHSSAPKRGVPRLLLSLSLLAGWGCGPVETVFVGDVHIERAGDVRKARHYARITGDLWIRETSLEEIALPALENVGGSLVVVGNTSLEELELPSLRRVGGMMYLDGAPSVVRLESLEEAGLVELRAPGPKAIHLPRLRELSHPEIRLYGVQLEFLDISALEHLNWLEFQRLTRLKRFDAPSLGSSPEDAWVREFRITRADALTELNADQLRKVGEVEIVRNGRLESLSMASLESIMSLKIIDNPLLPHCHAEHLLEHVLGIDDRPDVEIRGNNDPCDPNPCDGACIVDCSIEDHYRCSGDEP